MKTLSSGLVILLGMMVAPLCAAVTLSLPTTKNVGAGMATLVMKSDSTGTGYFTLLKGGGLACGTGAQVKAGKTIAGASAPYHGSLPLIANTDGFYSIRNLTQSTTYTICFTAESPNGSDLQAFPAQASLTTATATDLVGADWVVVGKYQMSPQAWDVSLAIAPDGAPYVAYGDQGNGGVSVKKLNNNSWVNVGLAGFSGNMSYYNALAFAPDGVPYTAFQDSSSGSNNYRLTVMKFNGAEWVNVGNPGFSPYPPETAWDSETIPLAFAPDGTPYIAYENFNGNNGANVMRFNGTAWVNVGNPNFSPGHVSDLLLTIAPDGTPYVAYSDYYGWSNPDRTYGPTVMKFDGTAWVYVGPPSFTINKTHPSSLAFSQDGTLYLAYQDTNESGNTRANVAKFNGTAWVSVGAPIVGAIDVYPSLAFAPDGTPYVAIDGNEGVTVLKFNGVAWVVVGSAGLTSQLGGNHLKLAFGLDGTPYVASAGSKWGFGVSVMKLGLPSTSPSLSLIGSNMTIGLTAGSNLGRNADWWMVAYAPWGHWYYYEYPSQWVDIGTDLGGVRPAYQGPIGDIATLDLFGVSGLPSGRYDLYFGVDTDMNGILDFSQLYYSSLELNIPYAK